MNTVTEESIQHIAMALANGGAIAKAVASTRDPLAVADMIIAQRLLRETLARENITCVADLSKPNVADEPRGKARPHSP